MAHMINIQSSVVCVGSTVKRSGVGARTRLLEKQAKNTRKQHTRRLKSNEVLVSRENRLNIDENSREWIRRDFRLYSVKF